MKDLGNINYFLGMHINQNLDKNTIEIDQIEYLKSILEQYGMSDCHSVSTPIEPNLNLLENVVVDNVLENKCRQLIGSLMYAMLGSRPDISVALSYLSTYQNKPSTDLWNALKRVLRYIKGTINLKLLYKKR